MGRRPKEIVYPHLNDCKGDVQGKWYVEFTVLNKITGGKAHKSGLIKDKEKPALLKRA
jgi:hypothetical protein